MFFEIPELFALCSMNILSIKCKSWKNSRCHWSWQKLEYWQFLCPPLSTLPPTPLCVCLYFVFEIRFPWRAYSSNNGIFHVDLFWEWCQQQWTFQRLRLEWSGVQWIVTQDVMSFVVLSNLGTLKQTHCESGSTCTALIGIYMHMYV